MRSWLRRWYWRLWFFSIWGYLGILFLWQGFFYVGEVILTNSNFLRIWSDETFVIALLLLLFLYLFVNTLLLIWYSFSFMQQFESREYEVRQLGNKLVIDFYKRPRLYPFFLQAKVLLINQTSGDKKYGFWQAPRAVLEDRQLIFDLGEFPSGYYRVEEVFFIFFDMFTLFYKVLVCQAPDNLKVTVFHGSSKVARSPHSQERDVLSADFSRLSQEAHEGYYRVRKYTAGDEIRKIHWKNTAKSGELMIRLPEEHPYDEEDLQVVINAYTPLVLEVDQQKSIGRFLDVVVKGLLDLCRDKHRTIHVTINTSKSVEIKHLNRINQDFIPTLILRKCVFQNDYRLRSFLKERKMGPSVVYSLSSDRVESEVKDRYIYPMLADFRRSYASQVKNVLAFGRVNRYAMLEFSLVYLIRRPFDRSPFYNMFLQRLKRLEEYYKKQKIQWL